MRVATVALVLTAAAVLVIISLIIATHSWPRPSADLTRRVRRPGLRQDACTVAPAHRSDRTSFCVADQLTDESRIT
jgi:hypothetical protein